MTNFSYNKDKHQLQQKLPLIPPATIRTSSSSASINRNSDQQAKPQSKMASFSGHHQAMNTRSHNSEVWSSVDDLFWDHISEVQNKWSTLKKNDDIWAKLIYFEQNRRLAKAYVSAPVLTVDGSTNGLDGFRIGLSGIDNTYRSFDSMGCLRSIGLGIKLKIDSQGNILIRKLGGQGSLPKCSIWIKDWPPRSSPTVKVSESCKMREIEQMDLSYKLFDMRKFRSNLEKRQLSRDNVMDWRQCVSIISFRRVLDDHQPSGLLEDPCWLMLINIIAIDMLKSTLCDRDSFNQQQESSLIYNHKLLESQKQAISNIPFANRPKRSGSTNSLFPTPIASNQMLLNSTDPVNERIKKLRPIDGAQYRMPPAKNGSQYSRHYQSSQQLSDSTIYTTFNSKFMNLKSQDYSSTSDYNSASRSSFSDKNNWSTQNSNNPFRQNVQSPSTRNRENKKNNQQKSSQDFSRDYKQDQSIPYDWNGQLRNSLRPLKSSIKINYDNVLSPGHAFDSLDETKTMASSKKLHKDSQLPLNGKNNVRQMSKLANPAFKTSFVIDARAEDDCCREVASNLHKNCSDRVNHNECQAMQNKESTIAKEQKISRSSIASSSSSSGCIDFVSHSSASSSTVGNERDPFSQPISSSGIVCSGSTSDDYDYGCKPSVKSQSSDSSGVPSPQQSVEAIEEESHVLKTSDKSAKVHRRGSWIKGANSSNYASCNQGSNCIDMVDGLVRKFDCACCCDCYSNNAMVDPSGLYGRRKDESIYGGLPPPLNTPLPPVKNSYKKTAPSLRKSDSFVRLSTLPTSQEVEKPEKTGGWLARRNYSKIFPKFILPSSSSNRPVKTQRDKSTRLWETSNLHNEKFRRTISSQNLA